METNVFFSAVQSALDAHIKRMVEEAVAPLLERITALENNPAIGVDTTLMRDVAAEVNKVVDSEDFWHRIGNYVIEQVGKQMDGKIEEAMDDHCSTYDHDDYDRHISDDDKHFEGDIEDAVRDTVRNMTFEVTLS